MEKLDTLKEKERLKKEYMKKEKGNIVAMPIFNDSSSFDFFDSLVSILFDTELKVLLVDIDISNGIPIVSQSS